MLEKKSPNIVIKRTTIILTNPYNQRSSTNLTMLEKNHLTWSEKKPSKLHKKVTILERGPSNMVT